MMYELYELSWAWDGSFSKFPRHLLKWYPQNLPCRVSGGSWGWGRRGQAGDRGQGMGDSHTSAPSHTCFPYTAQPEQASSQHHLSSSLTTVTPQTSLKSWWFHCGFGRRAPVNPCCRFKDQHSVCACARLGSFTMCFNEVCCYGEASCRSVY